MGRSRSSLPQSASTPSGSVVPSWLRYPPSNRCGSPSKNTTSLDHLLFTANVSRFLIFHFSFASHSAASVQVNSGCILPESCDNKPLSFTKKKKKKKKGKKKPASPKKKKKKKKKKS